MIVIGRRTTAGIGGGLLAGLALAAAPLPLTGQEPGNAARESGDWVVERAELRAEVRPDAADVDVRIEYTLVGPGSEGTVGVEVLDLGSARVEVLRVGATGEPLSLETEHLSRRMATVTPRALPGRTASTVILGYRVSGAFEADGADVRVLLPVPVLDLTPTGTGDPVFHATLALPEEWAVSGAFPTGLAPAGDGTWSLQLAVVPSMVSVRARADGAWRPGLATVLETAVFVVLLGFGAVGWRHLRRVATAPPA